KNALHQVIDLHTLPGQRWFYETVRDFFSQVPATHWARIDGKPLIFLYDLGVATWVDATLLAAVRAWFVRDFGVDFYLVNNDKQQVVDLKGAAAATPWAGRLASGEGLVSV